MAAVAYGEDVCLHYFPQEAGRSRVAMCGVLYRPGEEDTELTLMMAGVQPRLCEECLAMLRDLDVDPIEVSSHWEVVRDPDD